MSKDTKEVLIIGALAFAGYYLIHKSSAAAAAAAAPVTVQSALAPFGSVLTTASNDLAGWLFGSLNGLSSNTTQTNSGTISAGSIGAAPSVAAGYAPSVAAGYASDPSSADATNAFLNGLGGSGF